MRENTTTLKDRDFFVSKAGELISGQRAKDYGDAADSFGRVALIWSAVLGTNVTAEQVAACMVGLKLARLSNEMSHEDSWIDIIGYAALGGEISKK